MKIVNVEFAESVNQENWDYIEGQVLTTKELATAQRIFPRGLQYRSPWEFSTIAKAWEDFEYIVAKLTIENPA